MNRYACPCCGEDKVDGRAKRALEDLETFLGVQLTITSAYRCQKHNAVVGGAKFSRHTIHCDAFDIAWPNDETRKKFLDASIKAGFLGTGLAKTFVHIDRRPTRTIWIYK